MGCRECEEMKVWEQQVSRRNFLRGGAVALVALGALGPFAWARADGTAGLAPGACGTATAADAAGRCLVVVTLGGGNDGLNTVVPYGAGRYYDARPTIAIPQKDVLPLGGSLGLHPSLGGLKKLFDQGRLTVVNGVGYPNPNRSHFRSMEIWQTAVPDRYEPTGWLGRYLDVTGGNAQNPLRAVAVGAQVPLALLGTRSSVPAIESVNAFDLLTDRRFPDDREPLRQALRQMYDGSPDGSGFAVVRGATDSAYASAAAVQKAAKGYKPGAEYPRSGFARQLQLVVQLLAGGLQTQVFVTGLGGFDDHANEHKQYANLLQTLGDSLYAFYQDLAAHKLSDRVLVMTFSEFGRRVKENASGGTDHGTASSMFLIGDRAAGGLYGGEPSVSKLDGNGDLVYTTDFRAVYGTLLENWLGAASKDVLGQPYSCMGLVRA